MNPIQRVAIAGGTHGNELTGIYLINKFEQFPHLTKRANFKTQTLLGNPKAVSAGRRYIDKDLNRCFGKQNLKDMTLSCYEEIRAKIIQKILEHNGQSPVDVLLDLHSTTSNMGVTIILGSLHPFNLRLAAYISSMNPLIKLYSSAQAGREDVSLKSLGKFGFTIEVGPVAPGTLNAEMFQKTEEIVQGILDYLEKWNQGKISDDKMPLTLYQYVGVIDYPRNEQGKILAMIHPQLQCRDYTALHPGEPIFLTFDGEAIAYTQNTTLYPVFINEAAYYEKGIAMYLTEKQELIV
jgi:aspartoacylase